MTPYQGRRFLAARLYDDFMEKPSWISALEIVRQRWEADVEKLLDPRNEEIREAMRALGWHYSDDSA